MNSDSAIEPAKTPPHETIYQAIVESEMLIAHASKVGKEIDESILSRLVDARFAFGNGDWDAARETAFWQAYNQMAQLVKPVSIDSLKAVQTHYNAKGGEKRSQAEQAVLQFRILTTLVLFLLLIIQVYWLVGSVANMKLQELFEQKEEIKAKISVRKQIIEAGSKVGGEEKDLENERLQEEFGRIQQQQDANYEIIVSWNSFWQGLLLKGPYKGKIRAYREKDFDDRKQHAKREYEEVKNDQILARAAKQKMNRKLELVDLEEAQAITRNRLFLNQFSAAFVVQTVQFYILPLLYGLLGALLYVLRALSREITHQAYSRKSIINYRLRLTMGTLAGLAIGWFFTPIQGTAKEILPTFALAFLAGYNVEILFTLMDRMVAKIVGEIGGQTSKKDRTEVKNDASAVSK